MHRHTRCKAVWGVTAPSERVQAGAVRAGAGWADTLAGRYGPPPHMSTRRLPSVLPPAGDTPTDKSYPQANLSVYTHAPKTHTNTKQQGGISVHVFYGEYVYRLLCVRE